MNHIRRAIFLILLIGIQAAPVLGDVIHVPADQPTIQAGISAATPGDVVLVADGTYSGTGNFEINFLGKAVTVMSENGPAGCVVDADSSGGAFVFDNFEDQNSVLSGFTIINGKCIGSG